MKTINVEAMNRMDPEDIKDKAANDKERKQLRMGIIKKFLGWANAKEQKQLWKAPDAVKEDVVVLKRHKNF